MKALLLAALAAFTTAAPVVHDVVGDVKYIGFERNGVEIFQGIQYGQDTGGANRFRPPKEYVYEPGSTFYATKPGPACPQNLGQWLPPLTLGNITRISENCLNLNIVRPKDVNKTEGFTVEGGFPVMLWIHGGSFWSGSNMEPTTQPDGLIQESKNNNYPVIHVSINYRLGVFGFAQSEALKKEGSENAALRDQRLAIEWVKKHIIYFGGNPDRITIYGQSSGGLAVGMQLLAYGGTKDLPFQSGICESQALEPGITGNFTIDAMTRVAEYIGCNRSTIHSPEVIACLRSKDTQTLFDASAATYQSDIAHNIGDIWLPSVDGDFLPDAPSRLIADGRFENASMVFGWMQDDLNYFTDTSIKNQTDTIDFLTKYLPQMPQRYLYEGTTPSGLLTLYPVNDFTPPPESNLTAEFYRAARIFRDILMVCEPLYLAEAVNKKGNDVYLFSWNQTILDPLLPPGMGVIHTSEFAYTFGNLSHYNVSGYPFNPSKADYELMHRASRAWGIFSSTSTFEYSYPAPGITIQNWKHAFWSPNDTYLEPLKPGYTYLYNIGGPSDGFFALDGPDSTSVVEEQRLVERCGWINHPGIIPYLQY